MCEPISITTAGIIVGTTATTSTTVVAGVTTVLVTVAPNLITWGTIATGVALAGAAASAITTPVLKHAEGKAKNKAAHLRAVAEQAQITQEQHQESEKAAQQGFQLQRAALEAVGSVDNANLSDRSVKALGRAVNFELGTDQATVDRNVEFARQSAQSQLNNVSARLEQTRVGVGNLGAGSLAASITTGLIGVAAGGYLKASKN
jgi:hypothetical protein